MGYEGVFTKCCCSYDNFLFAKSSSIIKRTVTLKINELVNYTYKLLPILHDVVRMYLLEYHVE